MTTDQIHERLDQIDRELVRLPATAHRALLAEARDLEAELERRHVASERHGSEQL